MARVACIGLPNWPIQRLLAARPELRDRVVVLHVRDPRRGLAVAACSAAARRAGVRPGMPLAEATAMAPRAPEGFYEEAHDPRADEEALADLAQWCERFSPRVGREEGGDRTSLLLDITNLAGLFGGEAAMLGQLASAFRSRGYCIRIGAADTIGAAWAAAHFSTGSYTIVAPGRQAEALRALPVAALRLPQSMVERLAQLGVRRIEHLDQLPRSSLSSRFGDLLLQRWDQALGAGREPIEPHRPPPEFCAQRQWEHPVDCRDAIQRVLAELIRATAEQLADHDRGALRLQWRLDGPGNRSLLMPIELFRPTASPDRLLELARLQLERLTLPGAVDRVTVTVLEAAPLARRQGELLDGRARRAIRRLGLLIDRLASRLGRQCVVRPRLQADVQPERAYGYSPWTDQPSRPGSTPHDRSPPDPRPVPLGPADRPLKLRGRPAPLEVVSLAPHGRPIRFRWGGELLRIVRHWGPERIETGWWRGPSVRRDYYRVETEDGRRFWLYRRLRDGKWFLHGEFG